MTLRRVLWRSLGGPSQACVTPAASDQCSNCLPSHHPRFEDTPVRPSDCPPPQNQQVIMGKLLKDDSHECSGHKGYFDEKSLCVTGRSGCLNLTRQNVASNEKQGILSAYRQAHIYTHDISMCSCINIFNSFAKKNV